MESLRKIPALLKEHYEKVVLGLALLALAVSGVMLAGQRQQAEEALKQYAADAARKKPALYPPVDWTAHKAALKEGSKPVSVDFSPPHNLFNPVKWLRSSDGTMIKVEKGNEVGPEALRVTRITPLYLTINLDKASGATGYFISVTKEASTNVGLRQKIQSYVTPNTKDRTSTFTLKEAKGPADSAELALELLDDSSKITLTKEKPYQRVDGYKVDFSYPPEKTVFTEKRLNEFIVVGSETNSLIAITRDEVLLLNQSNGKRTPLRYHAAP